MTRPALGRINPETMRSSVLFPHPDDDSHELPRLHCQVDGLQRVRLRHVTVKHVAHPLNEDAGSS
jgi:hypothetical protein